MNNVQWLDEVKFNEQGLIPTIAQHHQTGRILMVAWMNRESLALTAEKNRPCISHVRVKSFGIKAKNLGTFKPCMKFVSTVMRMSLSYRSSSTEALPAIQAVNPVFIAY